MCCFCVAELSYLSPSLCWSRQCGLHSWSKASHSGCWHQLPWHRLKGVYKHCVSKADKKKKKQLTSDALVCWQSQGAQTQMRYEEHEWCCWARYPRGEREMCKLSHHVSSSCVSLATASLRAGGVAWGQQWELGAQTCDTRCLVTQRTDLSSTHTIQTETLSWLQVTCHHHTQLQFNMFSVATS